jgi:hypothetical protein
MCVIDQASGLVGVGPSKIISKMTRRPPGLTNTGGRCTSVQSIVVRIIKSGRRRRPTVRDGRKPRCLRHVFPSSVAAASGPRPPCAVLVLLTWLQVSFYLLLLDMIFYMATLG